MVWHHVYVSPRAALSESCLHILCWSISKDIRPTHAVKVVALSVAVYLLLVCSWGYCLFFHLTNIYWMLLSARSSALCLGRPYSLLSEAPRSPVSLPSPPRLLGTVGLFLSCAYWITWRTVFPLRLCLPENFNIISKEQLGSHAIYFYIIPTAGFMLFLSFYSIFFTHLTYFNLFKLYVSLKILRILILEQNWGLKEGSVETKYSLRKNPSESIYNNVCKVCI